MTLHDALHALYLLDQQVRGLQSRLDSASQHLRAQEFKIKQLTDQLNELTDQVADSSRVFELLVRSREVQARRPRAKADEDEAAGARRQKALQQWLSDVDAVRTELGDHQAMLNSASSQIRAIRKLEMTDEEIIRLVEVELGINNAVKMLGRGVRELDAASRRGRGALESQD